MIALVVQSTCRGSCSEKKSAYNYFLSRISPLRDRILEEVNGLLADPEIADCILAVEIGLHLLPVWVF